MPDHAAPGNYIEIAVRGTGLGLSQVYGFVRQSDGVVKIDSKPNEGTIVRLYLPGVHRIVNAGSNAVEAEPADFEKIQRRAVLIVEDQEGYAGKALDSSQLGAGIEVLRNRSRLTRSGSA